MDFSKFNNEFMNIQNMVIKYNEQNIKIKNKIKDNKKEISKYENKLKTTKNNLEKESIKLLIISLKNEILFLESITEKEDTNNERESRNDKVL